MKHQIATKGNRSERQVADNLVASGYKIIDLNWRTKSCEIDIVAECKKTMYFVEVKYRANSSYGNGFSYITSKKLAQMKYAARMWVQFNNYSGPVGLLAACVSGLEPLNVEILELTV